MRASTGDVSVSKDATVSESSARCGRALYLLTIGPFCILDPYCWTEYNLPEDVGGGRGTAWAWPSFLTDGEITDEQCQNDFVSPVISMQGHSAPLGLVFYDYSNERPAACEGIVPFPESYDGFAFVAFHGSWNRDIPTGYKVIYIPFDDSGNVIGPPVDVLAHEPPNAQWEDGFRPVDVDFDDCGRLIVTSDGTRSRGSKVVTIQYSRVNESKPTGGSVSGSCPCQSSGNGRRQSFETMIGGSLLLVLGLWMH